MKDTAVIELINFYELHCIRVMNEEGNVTCKDFIDSFIFKFIFDFERKVKNNDIKYKKKMCDMFGSLSKEEIIKKIRDILSRYEKIK